VDTVSDKNGNVKYSIISTPDQ